MNYNLDSCIAEINKILDENEVNNSLIRDNDCDTLSLKGIITQKIVDAARFILVASPNVLLDAGVNLPSTISWEKTQGNGMGWIQLPDDFCKLVIFQMSDWLSPVLTPIADSDPLYALQKSKYVGIKGSPTKPICVLTSNNIGKVLEFYSCNQGANVTIKKSKYLPYPSISNNSIEICKNLYTPSLYYAAALTAITYKDAEHGKVLMDIANTYIQ